MERFRWLSLSHRDAPLKRALFLKGGYRSLSLQLPSTPTAAGGPLSFTSVYLGGGGIFPTSKTFTLQREIDWGILNSGSSALGASAEGIYEWKKSWTFHTRLQFSSFAGTDSTGAEVSTKEISIVPFVARSF